MIACCDRVSRSRSLEELRSESRALDEPYVMGAAFCCNGEIL